MGRELLVGAFHDLWGLRKGHTHGEVWEACLWGVSCTLRPPATCGVCARGTLFVFGYSTLGMSAMKMCIHWLKVWLQCVVIKQDKLSFVTFNLFSFVFDYNYSLAGFVLLPYKRAPGAP